MTSLLRTSRWAHASVTALVFTSLVSALNILPAKAVTAHDYRLKADVCVAQGDYEQAAQYYRLEAAIYRKLGDVNGAKVEEVKADRWTTAMDVFANMPPDRSELQKTFTGAKFEPLYGCYLGGYVEADERLNSQADPQGHPLASEEAFNALSQKKLATYFQYCHYGSENFPRWAKELSRRGMAPHIALEPNDGLDAVKDDFYLEHFARDAAACGGPVFLRFAAEMNGDWTNYHNDPHQYRLKFRLVHDVMAQLAPNVAMIWCPNASPEYNIDEYYPGDDVVDWVGINFYSVLHHDNDRYQPASFENPADMLNYVYQRYGSRKPIAICEYGASHREALDPAVDRSDVACAKIAQLFAALPRQYPRVKLIDIFDCDNISHARAGRQLNDYSITNSPPVLEAFRKAILPDYFLSSVCGSNQKELPSQVRPLTAGASLSGRVQLSAFVKTIENQPTIVYTVDGKEVSRFTTPGEYGLELNTNTLSKGKHVLALDVITSNGKKAGHKEIPVVIGPPS